MLRYLRYTVFVCTCRYVAVCQIHCLYLPVCCGMSDRLSVPAGMLRYVRYTVFVSNCQYVAVSQMHCVCLSLPAGMLRYFRYTVSVCILPICCGMADTLSVCLYLPVCHICIS